MFPKQNVDQISISLGVYTVSELANYDEHLTTANILLLEKEKLSERFQKTRSLSIPFVGLIHSLYLTDLGLLNILRSQPMDRKGRV